MFSLVPSSFTYIDICLLTSSSPLAVNMLVGNSNTPFSHVSAYATVIDSLTQQETYVCLFLTWAYRYVCYHEQRLGKLHMHAGCICSTRISTSIGTASTNNELIWSLQSYIQLESKFVNLYTLKLDSQSLMKITFLSIVWIGLFLDRPENVVVFNLLVKYVASLLKVYALSLIHI